MTAVTAGSPEADENAEGVIRFDLRFRPAAAPPRAFVEPLQVWRQRLVAVGLVGHDPARYGGYGFGNLSLRHREHADAFVITGTQSGHLSELTAADFAIVTDVDVAANRVVAHGGRPPSSEAMTHAAIYTACAAANCVFHVHSPGIFARAPDLDVGRTPALVEYGTPAMAAAMRALLAVRLRLPDAFVMTSHADGVIAFGRTPDETGSLLLRLLA